LSLALNQLYGAGLSAIEAAQPAHIAEVECKTGLGTVMGEVVVSLVSEDKVDRVVSIYSDYVDYHDFTESPQIMICRIVQQGARVIEKV